MTSTTRKNRFFLLAAILCIIIVPSLLNAATTYYVSATAGNDTNGGTSSGAPFKTITKASQKAAAGDTVQVLAGTYPERVQVSKSGAAGALITYQAQGTVVCKGFTVNASYVRIIGFEITGTVNDWSDGPGVYSAGQYNEIRSNYIHDVTQVGVRLDSSDPDSPNRSNCIVSGNQITRAGGAGVDVRGRNHLVESNDISHSLQYPPGVPSPRDGADADGLIFLGSGHIIRKNTVHDIVLSDAGNIDPHIDCFQTWGPAYNMVFEQNYCRLPDQYMQGFMIEQNTSPVNNIMIRNNILEAFTPVNVWNCSNTSILNNTFKPQFSYNGDCNYGIMMQSSPNSRIKNNLFYDVGQHAYPYLYIDSASTAGTDIGYNAHYISDGKKPAGSPRTGDLLGVNPKLVDPAGDNLQLQAGSPLIDVGVALPDVTNDFNSVTRPQGAGYDMGAFEYGQQNLLSAPTNLRVVQ